MHQYALVPGNGDTTARPLLVLLHGFGNGARSWVREPAPKLLEQLDDQAPVVVSPDGGIDSWWLNRSSGDWETYVVDEVIPDAVERFGVDPERVAISGFSMGGAGAFTIAMHHPGRFCAVGGHDSAIATSFEESATSQFDSPAHFRANDVLAYAARSGAFPNADLSLDRGRDDVFISGQDAFVDALRSGGAKVDYRIEPGLHSMRSVRRHLAPAFDDYADALASCEQLDGAPRSSR
jgi:S-formylglutathione hydrolase FrmB